MKIMTSHETQELDIIVKYLRAVPASVFMAQKIGCYQICSIDFVLIRHESIKYAPRIYLYLLIMNRSYDIKFFVHF